MIPELLIDQFQYALEMPQDVGALIAELYHMWRKFLEDQYDLDDELERYYEWVADEGR